jgi:hypothetical protein
MKNIFHLLVLIIIVGILTSCSHPIQHADPFYNVSNDFSLDRIPLIQPFEITQIDSSSDWRIFLPYGLWVSVPNTQFEYAYNIKKLEKFSVINSIIIAYSSYIDQDAPTYIQENYYHWFVIIPEKKIVEGFQKEDEFRNYIQLLGMEDPNWETPEDALNQFKRTGCLKWIPDCK